MKLEQSNSIGLDLVKGALIKTSYGSGPYLVDLINGPCNCGRFSDELGYTNTGMKDWSPDHFHITCKDLDRSRSNGEPSYLNGYNLKDGVIKSVWTGDRIELLGIKKGTQLAIF